MTITQFVFLKDSVNKSGGSPMEIKTNLRLISLTMFITAVVFVFCALACPTLGRTIYIGDFVFGAEQWRFCYKIYAIVMAALFSASFFVPEKK